MYVHQILVPILAFTLAACATGNTVQYQQKPSDAGDDERLLLAEVSFILTRDQVARGELGFGRISNPYGSVMSEGFTDAEIDGGQVIAVRGSIYWANAASGNTHNHLHVALLPAGVSVDPGNVIEARYRGSTRLLRVERIRATSTQAGNCRYVEVFDPIPLQMAKDIVGFLSLIGAPGTATLYCKGIENEGWAINGRHWERKLLPTSALTPQ